MDAGCPNPDGNMTNLPRATVPGSADDLMFVYVSSKTGQHGVFNFTLHCQDMDLELEEEDFDTARRDYYNYIQKTRLQ